MGVLSITPSSVRLQNLGAVKQVNVDNGADEAYRSAAKVGDAVSGLGQNVGNIAIQLSEFERKTRFNDFVQDVQSNVNLLMNGDGQDNIGLIHEDFADSKEWDGRVEKERTRIVDDARKRHKINDFEWNTWVENMISPFRDQWDMRCANHAWAVADKNSQAAAVARRKTCEETLAMGDGSDAMYAAWVKSVNEEIEKSHVTDSTVAARIRREAGLRLVNTQFDNLLKIAAANTSDLEDVKDVRKKFHMELGDVILEDGTYDFSRIIKHDYVRESLGAEGLAGQEKVFESKYKAMMRAAEQAAQSRLREKRVDATNDSTNALTAMMLGEGEFGKDWESLSATEKAQRYEAWMKSSSGMSDAQGNPLDWENCLKKYAPDRAARVAVTINSYHKEAKRLAESQTKKADVQERKEAKATSKDYRHVLSQPWRVRLDDAGVPMVDAKGEVLLEPLTPQARIDMAMALWDKKLLNDEDMTQVVSVNRKEFTKNMTDLAQQVLVELGVKCPKAVAYHASAGNDYGEFQFQPYGQVKNDRQMAIDDGHNYTGDWAWWRPDAEDVYYSHCVEALNIAQDWLRANPEKTVEDGKEYVKNILAGKDAEGKYVRMKITEHFEHERKMLNSLEKNYRNLSPRFLGISPKGNVEIVPVKSTNQE